MKKIRKQIITGKTTFLIHLMLLSLTLLFCLTTVSAAPGDTIYVNGSGGNDSWDGSSITHTDNTLIGPKLSIKNATGTVNTNGTVHIANGQYTGENNTNITIDKNMNIIGESQSGTIINGTGTNWIFQIGSVNFTVQNLTIINATENVGGAICNDGSLTAINCTFTDNTADGDGGAIYNVGTISLKGCTFTDNKARPKGGSGGAIFSRTVAMNTVNNCIFTGNKAEVGGGILNFEGNIILSSCTFTGNTAVYGGAIANCGGLNANYNRFYNNTATTNGTAIYAYSGSVDANYNWWSSNKDPKTIQNLIYDPYNLVNATYWVILSVNATPNSINNTQNTTITVDLNHYTNSTGYVGELSTHIPDGQITLSIPWGSFTNSGITHTTTLNTVNNAVSTVFYANEGAVNTSYNPVKVTASADDYTTNNTESAYITINKTTKLYIKTGNSNNNPKIGETFLLTYKLGNKGPDAADNVTITFQLPKGLDFVNIHVDNGKCTYNKTTRTVTWTLDSVPVGDPYLYLTVKATGNGTYIITPKTTSTTYNLNSGDSGIITINVQPNNNNNPTNKNSNNKTTVNAASKITKTVGLQDTGLPINYLLLAVLMVFSGLIPKRK